MMFKFPRSRSKIQRRIFHSFLVVLILPTALISTSSYLISIHLLEQKVSNAFVQNLNYIGSNVERNLKEWENITDYIYVNHTIRSIVKKQYQDELDFFMDMLKADQVMNDFSLGSNLYSEISALVVIGENGQNLLYGSNVADLDINAMKQEPWYEEVKQLNGKVHWLGIQPKHTLRKTHSYVISLARTINIDNTNRAMIYLSFNEGFMRKMFKDVVRDPQTELQIVDNNNRFVFNNRNAGIYSSYLETEQLKEFQHAPEHYFISNEDGKRTLIASHYIEEYGWWVIEKTSYDDLIKDNTLIFYTTAIAFVISFVISGALWFIVAHSLVKPIKKLSQTMRSINGVNGNLIVRSNIKSDDEIGVLSDNFNYMLERINSLFQEVLEEQGMKKDAEYKALQAQINPHFLYNTLNTIRWMAIIQKADNIKDMVEVLGRLIRYSFKHTGTFVKIREELSSLQDYVYIQQIRYKDKFKVEYSIEEGVLDVPCVKFIMQPILENAIFHGVEPKEGHSVIHISVREQDDLIHISIRDNGIGMTEEQIKHIFAESSPVHGIGLSNVDERIKLTYGMQYGIKMESRPGEYTCVIISFPNRQQEDQNEHSDDC